MNQKPNILFIMCDQLRYDCLGHIGKYPVKTPNVDKLALSGMRFENAFTPIPLCCPARQALLNGRRPESFGVFWNYNANLGEAALNPSEFTWSKELKNRGYITGYFGKWHVNPHHDPTEYGFDKYVSLTDYKDYKEKLHPVPDNSSGFMENMFGGKDPLPLEDSRTHWLVGKVVDFINKCRKEAAPWHVRLDFSEPHLPCRPSGVYYNMYNPEEIPIWPSFYDEFNNKPYIQKQQLLNWNVEKYEWSDWAPVVARYYGIISQVDDAIGKVLDKVDMENTLIIFTSDHGDMCGAHKMMDKHYIMYDDVVRVPLIMQWPGVISENTVNNDFVYNCLDIPPTIMDILGLSKEGHFHGRSLLPILKGDKLTLWRDEVVSTYNGQQFGLYSQRMIRNRRWKYVWNATDIDELYDLENDPAELYNLFGEVKNAHIAKEMRQRLYQQLLMDGDGLVKNYWIKTQLMESRKY